MHLSTFLLLCVLPFEVLALPFQSGDGWRDLPLKLSDASEEVPTGLREVTPTPEPTMLPQVTPAIYKTPEPTMLPQVTPEIYKTPEPTMLPQVTPAIYKTPEPTMLPQVTTEIYKTPEPSMLPQVTPAIYITPEPSMLPHATPAIYITPEPSMLPHATPAIWTPSMQGQAVPAIWTPSMQGKAVPAVWETPEPSMLPKWTPAAFPLVKPSPLPVPSVYPIESPAGLPVPSVWPIMAPSAVPSVCFPPSSPPAVPSVMPSVIDQQCCSATTAKPSGSAGPSLNVWTVPSADLLAEVALGGATLDDSLIERTDVNTDPEFPEAPVHVTGRVLAALQQSDGSLRYTPRAFLWLRFINSEQLGMAAGAVGLTSELFFNAAMLLKFEATRVGEEGEAERLLLRQYVTAHVSAEVLVLIQSTASSEY